MNTRESDKLNLMESIKLFGLHEFAKKCALIILNVLNSIVNGLLLKCSVIVKVRQANVASHIFQIIANLMRISAFNDKIAKIS